MLYKVTPMLPEPEAKPKRAPGQPRRKRKSAIYDREGNEVLITLMCLKCRSIKPLAQFGLRKMADGAIRNQPWCKGCRSGAGTAKVKAVEPLPVGEVAPSQIEVEGEAAEPITGGSPPVIAAPSREDEGGGGLASPGSEGIGSVQTESVQVG